MQSAFDFFIIFHGTHSNQSSSFNWIGSFRFSTQSTEHWALSAFIQSHTHTLWFPCNISACINRVFIFLWYNFELEWFVEYDSKCISLVPSVHTTIFHHHFVSLNLFLVVFHLLFLFTLKVWSALDMERERKKIYRLECWICNVCGFCSEHVSFESFEARNGGIANIGNCDPYARCTFMCENRKTKSIALLKVFVFIWFRHGMCKGADDEGDREKRSVQCLHKNWADGYMDIQCYWNSSALTNEKVFMPIR